MGLGKTIKKAVEKAAGAASDVGKAVARTGLAVATGGLSEGFGVGRTMDALQDRVVDELTGKARAKRKEAKANELAALNAQEAAAKKAADADYYNRVMKARDAQVAAYMDSQTDLTSDAEALGNYGKTLGSFGETALGGKKKKMYY